MPAVIDRFADRFAFIDNSLGFTSVVSHMHGATGHISGPVTWWPEFELRFFDLMEEGQYAEADRWHARLAPYMAWHHGEHWESQRYVFDAAVVKASLEYVGLHGGPVRPPFRALGRGGEGGVVGDYRGDWVGAAGVGSNMDGQDGRKWRSAIVAGLESTGRGLDTGFRRYDGVAWDCHLIVTTRQGEA